MKKMIIGLLLMQLSIGTSGLSAQELSEEKENKFSMDVSLNSDVFFGFYPFASGTYGLNDQLDLSFYGILWSGGTGSGWGNWTEFGLGINYKAMEGLDIRPQIGFTGGNLLSSAAAGPATAGDGIVPNLTIALDQSKVEGELYAGFYLPLTDKAAADGTTWSFIHYWANLGYKFTDVLSIGGHYEHLILSGGSNVEEASDMYQWLGAYVQFADPKGGSFMRFYSGADLVEGNDSFFKLSVGYSF